MTTAPRLRLAAFATLVIVCGSAWGCRTEEIVPPPYLPTDAHDAYRHGLEVAGLADTALGRDWSAAAQAALARPVGVDLPFRETAFFDAAAATGVGFRFAVRRGQRVEVMLDLEDEAQARVFLDLFRAPSTAGEAPRHVASGEEGTNRLAFEPRRDAEYFLRVQPELLRSGRYSVAIRSVASLEFPVEGHSTSSIRSGFGAPRDAGRRQHHGVDIFTSRGTLAVSTSRAYVSRVEERELGGNVVWLRDEERSITLYYAHLEVQEAVQGTWVEPGDIVGRVGNTGNARTTRPHLHFGVYARGEGPVDPRHFLTQPRREPALVTADPAMVGGWARIEIPDSALRSRATSSGEPLGFLQRHTPVTVLGASSSYFRVRLPDGVVGYVSSRQVVSIDAPIATERLVDAGTMYLRPRLSAPVVDEIPPGEVEIFGEFDDFRWVRTAAGRTGWLAPD